MLPSKELMSEIVKMKINLVEENLEKDTIFYYCNKFGKLNGEINKYEFANYCKRWSWSKGYHLKSRLGWCEVFYDMECEAKAFDAFSKEGDGTDEVEAIIIATEWVLKNKKQSNETK